VNTVESMADPSLLVMLYVAEVQVPVLIVNGTMLYVAVVPAT
jgi:hypothetical protein